jgi:hypothetical protein
MNHIKDMLFYYGYLNSFNSAKNGWDNEKVAQEISRYNILVFGDGVQDPSHPDFGNAVVIIARIKQLNPLAKIFGYVDTTLAYSNFKTKASQWNDLSIHGIFFDKAGYDFGTNRRDFNDRVDFVHSLTETTICFINSWNIQHVLGVIDDPSFPNITFNPDPIQSDLESTDYYLLESFAIDNTGSYELKTQWKDRGEKAKQYQRSFGIQLVGLSVISDGDANGLNKFNFIYVSASMWSLDAVGSSNMNYGAGGSVKMWARPDVNGIGELETNESFVQSLIGSDVFVRYLLHGVLVIDFTPGLESSEIIKY